MATPIRDNRAALDASSAAEATGGVVVRATPGRVARGITSDSRAVVPGCAFVALRGDRFDGHAFVDAAIEAGASLVVTEGGRAPDDPRTDGVAVDDTLVAWGQLAAAHVRRWRAASPSARVVAVTGSAGKTTTKEMCAALLRTQGSCHATAGNLNNRVGMPAVAFGLEASHRFAVFEIGMSLPGEIAALAAIARPDVAIVLNAGLAHAGGVGGTIDDVAREKGALFDGVAPGGALVANADDPRVMAHATRRRDVRRVTFGRAPGADVRLVAREALGTAGSQIDVERQGRRSTFSIPVAGEAAALDFLAALAAAELAAGPIDDAHAQEALASLPRLGAIDGRMRIRQAGGFHIIDDAYNANPSSMRAALAALAEMKAVRRVAVLGEMKELGATAEGEHEALGGAVVDAGVSLLVSCGGLADAIGRSARARGIEVVFSDGAPEAARRAVELVREGDVVLVKASRSVGAERVVDALTRSAGGA